MLEILVTIVKIAFVLILLYVIHLEDMLSSRLDSEDSEDSEEFIEGARISATFLLCIFLIYLFLDLFVGMPD